ncbi:MAG: response regulator [Deltaproteobacteria bacterium]|nr:response regulator [Deltaproteobacteria bacterium]
MADEKKTILVVDDEPDVREYITAMLEDNGYLVKTANDGQQALDAMAQGLPDLITLDVSMPEKSGVRLYRDMKESDERKHVPIIMITGVDSTFEKFISSRKQVSAPDGYIQKPIDQTKLLELVKKLTS